MMATSKRRRRSTTEKIAELEAQIAKIRRRAEEQKVKKDPALRHISAAVRSLDKALEVSRDKATRGTLNEARGALAACLKLNNVQVTSTGSGSKRVKTVVVGAVEPKEVIEFVEAHPGCRCEDVASALGVDSKTVGPVLRSLKGDGELRTQGQARGTRYYRGS